METAEAKVNLEAIEKDLALGLKNAEMENVPNQGGAAGPVPVKSQLVLPNVAVKLVCDIKNSIAAKFITKDLDEDSARFVREYLKTTPKEVELYKQILNQLGTDHAPESYKEILNKWLLSPLVILLEYEIERFLFLRTELKIIVSQNSQKKAAA